MSCHTLLAKRRHGEGGGGGGVDTNNTQIKPVKAEFQVKAHQTRRSRQQVKAVQTKLKSKLVKKKNAYQKRAKVHHT